MIRNCDITVADITATHHIFGPNVDCLMGKTVQKRPDLVMIDYVEVPQEILDFNNDVTIAAYVFFVNSLTFLVSVYTDIKFTMVEYLPLRN